MLESAVTVKSFADQRPLVSWRRTLPAGDMAGGHTFKQKGKKAKLLDELRIFKEGWDTGSDAMKTMGCCTSAVFLELHIKMYMVC